MFKSLAAIWDLFLAVMFYRFVTLAEKVMPKKRPQQPVEPGAPDEVPSLLPLKGTGGVSALGTHGVCLATDDKGASWLVICHDRLPKNVFFLSGLDADISVHLPEGWTLESRDEKPSTIRVPVSALPIGLVAWIGLNALTKSGDGYYIDIPLPDGFILGGCGLVNDEPDASGRVEVEVRCVTAPPKPDDAIVPFANP